MSQSHKSLLEKGSRKESFNGKIKVFRWPILIFWIGVIVVLTSGVYSQSAYRRETTLYDSVNNYMLASRDASVPAWAFATGLFGRGLHLNFTAPTSWPVNQTPQNFENRNTIAVFNKTFGNRTYEFWFRINKTGQTDNDGLLFIGATSTGGAGILIDTQGSGKLRISTSYARNDTDPGDQFWSKQAYQAKRIDVGDAFWTSRGLIAYWPFNGSGNATHFKEFANGGASYWAKRGLNASWYVNTTYGYYPWDNGTQWINKNKVNFGMNVSRHNLLNRSSGSIIAIVKPYNASSVSTSNWIIHAGENKDSVGDANSTGLAVDYASSNKLIGFAMYRGGNTSVETCSASTPKRFETGQWYSLVGTWNTSDSNSDGWCEIWVNGSLVTRDTTAYIRSSLLAGEYKPYTSIGHSVKFPNTRRYFNGTIDELAIFAQQLNQSDIQKIAWSNFTDNQWHHVALIYGVYGNKGNIGYFVDGRKYGQFNNTNTTHLNPATGYYVFQVGCSELSCATPAVNTIIDNLRVSNITRFGMFNGSFTPKKYMINDRNTLAFWTFDYPINKTSLRFCKSLQLNEALVLNATFHDEVNSSKMNITSVNGNFRLQGHINSSQIGNINLSQANLRYLSLCITPATENFKVNASIKIAKNGWNYRHIYYDYRINNLSNATIFPKWYLLQDTKATLISILLTDSLDSPLKNIITEIQRFYISNNTWSTIGMIKSGEDGKDAVYLQQNEPDYRFNVFQNGKQVKLTTGQKLTALTYTIKITSLQLSQLIRNLGEITTSLAFNNATGFFTFTYADPNNAIASACITTTSSNSTGSHYMGKSCQNSTFSGSISKFSGTGGMQSAKGYVIISGQQFTLESKTIDTSSSPSTAAWGLFGIFIVILLIMAFPAMQMHNPTSMVTMFIVVIIAVFILGIVNLTVAVATGIVAIGIILIILMRT